MYAFDYLKPESLEEVGDLLSRGGMVVNVLAGGTNLVLALEHGKKHADLVIDLKGLPELDFIDFNTNLGLTVGATTTLSQIIEHSEIRRYYPLLIEVCSKIGSHQIRNRATIGGNLCTASPSSDLAPVLLCYDAVCHVWHANGERSMPLQDFFVDYHQTALTSQDLLKYISLAKPAADVFGVYNKLQRGKGDHTALVGAAVLGRKVDGGIGDWRIALASCASTPVRLYAAEDMLQDTRPNKALIQQVAEQVMDMVSPIDDLRATAAYRRAMAGVLVRRGIETVAAQLLRGER